MDLIEFPEQTVVIAKDQAQYRPMPAHRFPDDPSGRIVCGWKLTLWERIRLLFGGIVWQQIMTFNNPVQPQRLTIEKPEMDGAINERSA